MTPSDKVFVTPTSSQSPTQPVAKTVTECFAFPKEHWRYISIPDTDLYDAPHPGVRLNGTSYGSGKHYLPNPIADEIEERLHVFNKSSIRVLRPNQDTKALRDLGRAGSPNPTAVPAA